MHVVDQNIPEDTVVVKESNYQQNGGNQVRNAQGTLHVLTNGTSSSDAIPGAEAQQTISDQELNDYEGNSVLIFLASYAVR